MRLLTSCSLGNWVEDERRRRSGRNKALSSPAYNGYDSQSTGVCRFPGILVGIQDPAEYWLCMSPQCRLSGARLENFVPFDVLQGFVLAAGVCLAKSRKGDARDWKVVSQDGGSRLKGDALNLSWTQGCTERCEGLTWLFEPFRRYRHATDWPPS